MSIEVMRQAREAIEWALDFIPPESETDCECPLCAAHDALDLAIEQAERVKRAEEAFAAASEEMKGDTKLERVNAQLLEALDYFMQCVEQSAHLDARIGFIGGAFDKARAAIAAAKGEA